LGQNRYVRFDRQPERQSESGNTGAAVRGKYADSTFEIYQSCPNFGAI